MLSPSRPRGFDQSSSQSSSQAIKVFAHPRPESWWTGIPVTSPDCPGLGSDGYLRSLPMPDLRTCTREEVLHYFNNSWTLTELLFSSLTCEEAFFSPPYHGLRHPLVFYYIHPAVLYINKLRVAEIIDSPINSEFEALFETGVDEMSWDDMSKNQMDWPDLETLHRYRKRVYKTVSSVIQHHEGLADGHPPITQTNPLWALFMGFEHERIHLETSSVLIRELPSHLVSRPEQWAPFHPGLNLEAETVYPPREGIDYPTNNFLSLESGTVSVGKQPDHQFYGWDNEYGHREARVDGFSASRLLISNGEFWQFVASGGYHEEKYWSQTGWRWRTFRNTKWPTFWVPDGPAGSHRYRLRTVFEVIPMQWHCPAIVNFHEAEAYCRWLSATKYGGEKQLRLLSENEHHRLRQSLTSSVVEPDNLNLRYGSESPVGTVSGDAFEQVFGNVWQWCVDHFNPLPDFKVHKFYDDFSTPCYDGEHQMIMGGSFVSTGDEATPWARFHFRPHFFQHAGFRVVESQSDGGRVTIGSANTSKGKYEEEKVLNEYLTLHYAPPEVQMPHGFCNEEWTRFPQRCAQTVIDWADKLGLEGRAALDVGCAVGGATFKLAERFDSVTGVDISESFIRTAKQLQTEGAIDFCVKSEGVLFEKHRARIDETVAPRVKFRRADACSLPAEYVDFDAVLLANLLCRIPSPMSCLSRMGGNRGIVKRGGLLVITTPFTWMEQFSQKEVWLGGFVDENGNERLSEDGLRAALEEEFELLDKFDMPLVIREHKRKFELIASLATVWRRK